MNELNIEFNNYIEEFKKLDVRDKRDEFIRILKEFIVVLETIAKNEGVETTFLKNREILDLQNEFVSEDDFIEASLVYLENAKNIIGEFLEKKLYGDLDI